MSRLHQSQWRAARPIPLGFALVVSALAGFPAHAAVPSRSTNIALTSPGDSRLINLNHDSGSVTVFQVNSGGAGQGALTKLAEVVVGGEPECVAVHPSNSEAYVTNADGYVSVVSLQGADANTVVAKIAVRNEPRGCALTPSGNILYVANLTHGSVSIINTSTRTEAANTGLGSFGRPYAITVSDDGDPSDTDERVFVTDFLASVIPAAASGPGRPFDTGNRGFVRSFGVGDPSIVTPTVLSPVENAGFNADRTLFCQPAAQSQVYCPNPLPPDLTQTPQGAFPNQLYSALIRNNQLFVTTIAAAPEPPVRFNVNVQSLVYSVNTATLQESLAGPVNLNSQIALETQPAVPTTSLGRLFGGDIVAVDANQGGTTFLFVSRGGDYVLRAQIVGGQLSIGAPGNVVRFRTGHTPTGVVFSRDGSNRAYTNNEVGRSVSVLNLNTSSVVARDIESTALPQIGSYDHNVLMGKLVFFTSLGVPDNGLAKASIRGIDTLANRGKQSDNGWSSCASCHPAGLADGVTWIFPDGPRQTISLDTVYSKRIPTRDARILNWSAVRGSNTDFDLNSRGVQGGLGFVTEAPNAATVRAQIKNHGITQGASEALDDETLWISTIDNPSMPQELASSVSAGRQLFIDNCASCHGSNKWTKSQVLYGDDPALVNPTTPTDTRVTIAPDGAGQIQSFACPNGTSLIFLHAVGTFNTNSPLEIRANASKALGTSGFNVPSLMGVRFSGPYFHDGSAETLNGASGVFGRHTLPGGGTINSRITSAADQANLLSFLRSIDGRTDTVRSRADNCRGIPN
jgi:YVTN family beta-propeller protein